MDGEDQEEITASPATKSFKKHKLEIEREEHDDSIEQR